MRAATGRPLAAVPAAVEAFPRLGQRNIGSQSADQQAEVRVSPSCVLPHSRHALNASDILERSVTAHLIVLLDIEISQGD